MAQIFSESGTHFDPLVVDAFRALDKEDLLSRSAGTEEFSFGPVSDRELSAVG